MLTCGPRLAEGEGGNGGERAHVGRCAREGESATRAGRKWAGARPTRGKGRERGVRGGGRGAGPPWPMREKEREKRWAG
jgi:hypothetical protein